MEEVQRIFFGVAGRWYMRLAMTLMILLANSDSFAQSIDTFPELRPDTVIEGLPPILEEEKTVVMEPPAQEYEDDDNDDDEQDTVTYFHPLWMTLNWGDSLSKRKISLAYKRRLQADEDYWYANAIFTKEDHNDQKPRYRRPVAQHPVFQTILWILIIGGFAAAIMIYLYQNNIGFFRRNKSLDKPALSDDEGHTDIFSISYQQQIDKARATGNYRLAVRLHFLATLRSLADRQLINYKTDSTNFDYLLQLQSTAWYSDFFSLVRTYEYSWYGMFEIDSEQYQRIANQFQRFQQRMS